MVNKYDFAYAIKYCTGSTLILSHLYNRTILFFFFVVTIHAIGKIRMKHTRKKMKRKLETFSNKFSFKFKFNSQL